MGPYSTTIITTIITAIIIIIIVISIFERNSRKVGKKIRVFLQTRVGHISQVLQSLNGSFVQIFQNNLFLSLNKSQTKYLRGSH